MPRRHYQSKKQSNMRPAKSITRCIKFKDDDAFTAWLVQKGLEFDTLLPMEGPNYARHVYLVGKENVVKEVHRMSVSLPNGYKKLHVKV